MNANRMKKPRAPRISSESFGYRRSLPSWEIATNTCTGIPLSDDEREHEPDQGQRLDQPDPDEHRPADQPRRFRLPGHGLHRLAHEDADPDARADGGQTVGQPLPDRAHVARGLRQQAE